MSPIRMDVHVLNKVGVVTAVLIKPYRTKEAQHMVLNGEERATQNARHFIVQDAYGYKAKSPYGQIFIWILVCFSVWPYVSKLLCKSTPEAILLSFKANVS